MNISEKKLPSNKKFGFFFSFISTICACYCYFHGLLNLAIFFVAAAITLFAISLFKPDVLHTLNKLWMRLGLIINKIISPIILGLIFFGIFTPVAFLMRLTGRDELRLKIKKSTSHWIVRNIKSAACDFENQF